MEHRAVAQAVPGGRVRRMQDRLHFLDRQMPDQPRLRPFGWDGEDALNLLDRGGLTEFHEVHERLDRRQPDVAGARAIGAVRLEMIQKADDQGRVDLLQGQSRR